jgi:glycosyltransferase involved in cell wall biosynthesis
MPTPIALDYRPALLSPAGIGRATRELANALAARDDVTVHLFAHSLARARVALPVPPRAHLHRLPIPGRSLPFLARFGLGADRLAGGPQVFHWTDYVMPPVTRARVVLTVHDLAFVRDARWHGDDASVLRERTRAAIAAATALVVPSQATAADLRTFAPDAKPTHVIPFGADHAPAHTANAPAPFGDRPYVLCVGTIEPRKNHLALLAAFRLLPAPRPQLLVVGRIGWQCDAIVAALRAAAAEGWLVWRQDVDDAALWPLLQHAAALAYPSAWEGFGFPPLEAMQLGVPVVANDIAPLRELGDGAFLFADANDPSALAAAIDRAVHDADARAAAIAAGHRRAERYRWADCAAAHAAVYREVAAC